MSAPCGPPCFFPQIFLARHVPWPEAALTGPLNPEREFLLAAQPGSVPYIRLAYRLWHLPAADGAALLNLAARTGREVLVADFKAAERNLEVPACLLARVLSGCWPGAHGGGLAAFLKQGGLEGLARQAGLRVLWRRPLLGGAAVVLRLCGEAAPAPVFQAGCPDCGRN